MAETVEKKDIDTGGFAFPRPEGANYGVDFGMTLRDYFAGQALIGIMGVPEFCTASEADLARYAYAQADAMIERRKD